MGGCPGVTVTDALLARVLLGLLGRVAVRTLSTGVSGPRSRRQRVSVTRSHLACVIGHSSPRRTQEAPPGREVAEGPAGRQGHRGTCRHLGRPGGLGSPSGGQKGGDPRDGFTVEPSWTSGVGTRGAGPCACGTRR